MSIEPCPHIQRPSHMKGWEAFGVAGDDVPLVRRLGHWGGKGMREWIAGTEPWTGDGSVHKGVSSILIETYGDNTLGAYIYVCGTTQKAVTAAWYRGNGVFLAERRSLWP